MKLCRFNYFLKQGEKIIYTFNCHMKSLINFQILNEDGIILASDSRLLFCNMIGDHPNLLVAFDYKYITNTQIKEDNSIFMKHNGEPIKITNLDKESSQKIIETIEKYKQGLYM